MYFRNRSDAGKRLAARLDRYRHQSDVVVLALPRGGVPVGFEIARHLGAPLDLLLVRKLGTPGQEELAMGALASGGVRVLNDDLIRRLHIAPEAIERTAALEAQEIARREKAYRGPAPPPEVAGKTVILVDDGIATGSTLFAALQTLRRQHPARIVIAVPVASPAARDDFADKADEWVVLVTPPHFFAVGEIYDEFRPVPDSDVVRLLEISKSGDPSGPPL